MVKDTLYVIPTANRCNKHCNFCITKTRPFLMKEETPFLKLDTLKKEIQDITKFINDDDVRRVEITGGGEPTLNKALPGIISFFHNRIDSRQELFLYTNGVRLAWFAKDKVDTVTVSTSVYDIFNRQFEVRNKWWNALTRAAKHYSGLARTVRLRVYVDADYLNEISSFYDCLPQYFDRLQSTRFSSIVFGKDFRSKEKLPSVNNWHPNDNYKYERSLLLQRVHIPVKIDNSEKDCESYPLLWVDGKIYETWPDVGKRTLANDAPAENTPSIPESIPMSNPPKDVPVIEDDSIKDVLLEGALSKGYHLSSICKGEYGTSKKILEEVQELIDAEKQGSNIMCLVELSDILGAVEGYLKKHYGNVISFLDLSIMKDITRRAFESGDRK